MTGRVDGLEYGRSAFSLTCTIFGARNIKVMQGSRAKAEVIAKLEEEGKLVFVQHGPTIV